MRRIKNHLSNYVIYTFSRIILTIAAWRLATKLKDNDCTSKYFSMLNFLSNLKRIDTLG